MLNASLERYLVGPHALLHEIFAFIYIDWYIVIFILLSNFVAKLCPSTK